MALAQVQYTQSVVGNKNFSVPFPYISRDHIKVVVNGLEVAFTWTNNSTVSLATAPAVGDIIDVRRETERVNLLVDFQDASTITEAQLDLSAKQAFFIAQEAFDATGGTMSVANDGSYSAAGRRIRDIGSPINANDAVNKQWVMDQYNSGTDAGIAKAEAEAARDKAKRWADDPENTAVETGKYSAKHHAIKSAASAAASQASADSIVADELLASQKASEAAASASAAQTARTGSEAARDASVVAKNAAELANTDAQAAKTTATGARDTTLTYRDTTLTYRDSASSHATNAGLAKDGAVAAEQNASSHATNASNSSASASQSMNKAYNWAESAEDFPVEPGKYSSKHHATKAAASASAASASASASQTSADASAASATEAAGYAAGVNLPSALGQGGNFIRQKVDETGFEYIPEKFVVEKSTVELAENAFRFTTSGGNNYLQSGDKTAVQGGYQPLRIGPWSTTDFHLEVSQNGIRSPSRPAFYGTYSGFGTSTSFTRVGSYTTIYNQGNHLNPSTGVFTVPVTGIYIFTFGFLRDTGTNNVYRAHIHVNGATMGAQYRTTEGYTGYNEPHAQVSILHLTANDQVDLRVRCDKAGGSIYQGGGYNFFQCAQIG